MARIIDGKGIAADMRKEIKEEVAELRKATGRSPGFAVVIVGTNKESQTYVRMKGQAAQEAGMNFVKSEIPESISQEELLQAVKKLNEDPDINGLIVQLPLPAHLNEKVILDAISIEKDIDGFHPLNIGNLALKGRTPLFESCTPKACLELLKRSGVPIAGKHAVVLGRSNIVGLPVSLLLLKEDATVTVCHSRTANLKEVVQNADILIAAVGKPEIVRGDWLKKGVVVIDVGTNAVSDTTKKLGYRLVGDVAFEEAKQVASAITPVPGGVGPMTVTVLLSNTLKSFKRSLEKEKQN